MSSHRANKLAEAGAWLLATGDRDGARKLFQQALQLDPNHPRARKLLATVGEEPAPKPGPAGEAKAEATRPAIQAMRPPAPVESLPARPEAAKVRAAPLGRTVAPAPAREASAADAWESATHTGPTVDLGPTEPEPKDALELIIDSGPTAAANAMPDPQRIEEVATLIRGAKDLIELDDHSGAVDLIARAEALAPGNPEVRQLRAESERTLQAMLESKLGRLSRVPRVILKEDEVIWLNLDHRAGFVLAQIDGTLTYEDVFAVSGMSRLDTARILVQLLEEGVIRA